MSILRSLLTSYKLPSVTIAAGSTLLDASAHHARTLVVMTPGTIAPPVAFATVGDGFWCDVLNLSGGPVVFVTTAAANTGGIITPGANTLANLGTARLRATTANGSAGSIVLTIAGSSAASPAITLIAPAGVVPSAAYTVTGLLSNYATAPSLSLSVDAGPFGGLPAGSTASATVLRLNMPGLAAGPHTLQVRDAGGVLSNMSAFTVAPAVAPTLLFTSVSSMIAGTTATLVYAFANGLPTGATLMLDGSAAALVSGPAIVALGGAGDTSSGTVTSSLVVPSAGTHVLAASTTGPFAAGAAPTSWHTTDAAPPSLTINSVDATLPGSKAALVYAFANGLPAGAVLGLDGVAVTLNGGPTITTTSGSGATAAGTVTFALTVPAAGTHTVVASTTGTYAATASSYAWVTAPPGGH